MSREWFQFFCLLESVSTQGLGFSGEGLGLGGVQGRDSFYINLISDRWSQRTLPPEPLGLGISVFRV